MNDNSRSNGKREILTPKQVMADYNLTPLKYHYMVTHGIISHIHINDRVHLFYRDQLEKELEELIKKPEPESVDEEKEKEQKRLAELVRKAESSEVENG